MTKQTAKTIEWQNTGGSFNIPDGWFVHYVNLDIPEPCASITNEKSGEDKTILIPKALAYYLGTHFCGSYVMRDQIVEDAKRTIRNAIKNALDL